jgi:hypothetical protein
LVNGVGWHPVWLLTGLHALQATLPAGWFLPVLLS